jgi:hypothetical protein
MNPEIINLLKRYIDILPNEYLFTYLNEYPQLIEYVQAPNFSKNINDNIELLEYILKNKKSEFLQNWLNFLRAPNNLEFRKKVVLQNLNDVLKDEGEQDLLVQLSQKPTAYFTGAKDSEGFPISKAKVTPDEQYLIKKACLADPSLLYFFEDAIDSTIKHIVANKNFKNILFFKPDETISFVNTENPLDVILSSSPSSAQELVIYLNNDNVPEYIKEFVENLLFISDKKDYYEPAKTVYDLLNSFDIKNFTAEQAEKLSNSMLFKQILMDPNNRNNHVNLNTVKKYKAIFDDYLQKHNSNFEEFADFINKIYTYKTSKKVDQFFSNNDAIIHSDNKIPQDIQTFGDENYKHIDKSIQQKSNDFDISNIENKYLARNAVYLDNENFFKLSKDMQSDPLVYNAAINSADSKTIMSLFNALNRLNVEIPNELKQKIKNIQSTDTANNKHMNKINQFFKSQLIDPAKK